MTASCSMCGNEFPPERLDVRPLPVPGVDERRVTSLYRFMRALLIAPEGKIYFRISSAKGRHLRVLADARYVSKPRWLVGDQYVTELQGIPRACRPCSSAELSRLVQAGREFAEQRRAAADAKAEAQRHLAEKRAAELMLKQRDAGQATEGGRSPIPARLRFLVLRRDGFRCVYCGRAASGGLVLHIDHVLPKSRGGVDVEDNLVTACSDCNLGKAATLVTPDVERDPGTT